MKCHPDIDTCEQHTICFMYLKHFLLPEFIILNEFNTPTVSGRKPQGMKYF